MEQLSPKAAWAGVCMLAMKDGVKCVADLPNGLYERNIGKEWRVVLNAGKESRNHIPPMNIAVEFNGWPAGIIGPGGGLIAAGEIANEDAFIAAIEEELGRSIDDALNSIDGLKRQGEQNTILPDHPMMVAAANEIERLRRILGDAIIWFNKTYPGTGEPSADVFDHPDWIIDARSILVK